MRCMSQLSLQFSFRKLNHSSFHRTQLLHISLTTLGGTFLPMNLALNWPLYAKPSPLSNFVPVILDTYVYLTFRELQCQPISGASDYRFHSIFYISWTEVYVFELETLVFAYILMYLFFHTCQRWENVNLCAIQLLILVFYVIENPW